MIEIKKSRIGLLKQSVLGKRFTKLDSFHLEDGWLWGTNGHICYLEKVDKPTPEGCHKIDPETGITAPAPELNGVCALLLKMSQGGIEIPRYETPYEYIPIGDCFVFEADLVVKYNTDASGNESWFKQKYLKVANELMPHGSKVYLADKPGAMTIIAPDGKSKLIILPVKTTKG